MTCVYGPKYDISTNQNQGCRSTISGAEAPVIPQGSSSYADVKNVWPEMPKIRILKPPNIRRQSKSLSIVMVVSVCFRILGGVFCARNAGNQWDADVAALIKEILDYTDAPLATPCEIESVGRFATSFIPVTYVVVFVLDLIGNGLVLYVLIRRPYWLLADHYLFQLALSDLLLGFTLPFWVFQYNHGWIFGHIPCKVLSALFTINIYSTIFFLACISLNRYFSIVHAIELHKMHRPIPIVLICIAIWAVSGALSWQDFYFRDVVTNPDSERQVCINIFPSDKANSWRITVQLVEIVTGFIIPLVFMSFSYVRIFCTLQRSRSSSRRSQLVIVVLLLVFILFWTPYKALQLIDSLQRLEYIKRDCDFENKLDIAMILGETLGLSHVCINPIIYAFVGVKFRKEIYNIFKRVSNQVLRSRSEFTGIQDYNLKVQFSINIRLGSSTTLTKFKNIT
ncbi:C-X-C chemokine receptor type 1-like [Gastrophryne carolinensis]